MRIINIILMGLVGFMVYTIFFNYQMSKDKALRILEANGYKNIETNPERDWFTCHKGEFYQIQFIANGQNGSRVKGVVCETLVGSTTIRFK